MDKNGQRRGGARRGAGRKPKGNIELKTIEIKKAELKGPAFFDGEQFGGEAFLATEALSVISGWLKENDVLNQVPKHLLEMYACSLARWIQAEEHVNQTGFLAKHPTTGAPIQSPYVNLSLEYAKAAQGCWWQIYQMIKDATGGEKKMQEPTNGLLELLRRKEA